MNDKFNKITNEMFIQAFNESISKEDIFKKLNISSGGNSTKFVNKMIEKLNLSLDILKQNRFNKYHLKKTCPVCDKEFYTNAGKKARNKICCSHSCSNTYFRSGENNGMYKNCKFKGKCSYVIICFRNHPHKCCICGEEKIVAVHHYDGNHNNNEVDNLIPLCPTHHCYIHSKYKDEIQDKVDEYRKKFLHSDILTK